MTTFSTPMAQTVQDTIPVELKALAHLEATPNAIRLRIAGLAPDQIYRGTTNDLSIAELVALAVERERAYRAAFATVKAGEQIEVVEPEPVGLFLDRVFHQDLATFFDLRRATLDILRTVIDAEWVHAVSVRGSGSMTLRDLAVRLESHDMRLLETISRQRHGWMKTSGVDELRDGGVAGKLSPNIGQ